MCAICVLVLDIVQYGPLSPLDCDDMCDSRCLQSVD